MGFSSAWSDTQECQAQDCGTHVAQYDAQESQDCAFLCRTQTPLSTEGVVTRREDEEKEDK